MIRFLTLIIFLSLIYLSAIMIGKYDATLSIGLFDYIVRVSFLFILIFFVFILSLFTLGIRFFTWIIMLPFTLIGKVVGIRRDHQIHKLLDSYALIIMEKEKDASKKLSSLSSIPREYKDHENFLKALASKDSEKDAYQTYERIKNKNYHDFAAKNISTTLFNKGLYDQALKFMEGAEIDKSKDPEIIYMMLVIYAELDVWDKFLDKIGSLKGKYKKDKERISDLYMRGAKYFLEEGKEKKALELLEKSLEHNPASIGAIEIFCTLNNSQGTNHKNLPILEAAFSLNPSFELFELYCASSSMNPEELYDKFYNLVNPKKYRDVLLSIAAFLKLFDKVDSLLSCKI